MLSNLPLLLPDMAGAVVGRIVPIVMNRSLLGEEDITLTDKLMVELLRIFNWAAGGHR